MRGQLIQHKKSQEKSGHPSLFGFDRKSQDTHLFLDLRNMGVLNGSKLRVFIIWTINDLTHI